MDCALEITDSKELKDDTDIVGRLERTLLRFLPDAPHHIPMFIHLPVRNMEHKTQSKGSSDAHHIDSLAQIRC